MTRNLDPQNIPHGLRILYDEIMVGIEPALLLENIPLHTRQHENLSKKQKAELLRYFDACLDECFTVMDEVLKLYAQKIKTYSKQFMHEQKNIAANEDESRLQEITNSIRTV